MKRQLFFTQKPSCFLPLAVTFSLVTSQPSNPQQCAATAVRVWEGIKIWQVPLEEGFENTEKYWFTFWNQQGIHHSFCAFVLLLGRKIDEYNFPDFLEKDLNRENDSQERKRREVDMCNIDNNLKGKVNEEKKPTNL